MNRTVRDFEHSLDPAASSARIEDSSVPMDDRSAKP
jgi:hypothetical protein